MTLQDVISCFAVVSSVYPWLVFLALMTGLLLGYFAGRKA